MNWFYPIDLYCERTAAAIWGEPINAASNLAFIAAAGWAVWSMPRLKVTSPLLVTCTALCFLVGIGSFLFHTFANAWSEQADVIPIWTFVALYIVTAVSIFGQVDLGRPASYAVIAAAFGLSALWIAVGGVTTDVAGLGASADPFNGSQQYLPALAGLLAFVFFAHRRRVTERRLIDAAALVFALSLAARSVDLRLCALVPFGTHFLWHILNATMMGLLLQAAISHAARRLEQEAYHQR